MKSLKFVLINSLPLKIISGGNVYNHNLCLALKEKGIEIEYIFTKNCEETIVQIDEDCIILLDSYCLNEQVNWNHLMHKKIIVLLHLAPSADDQKNHDKLSKIIEAEQIVFKNFPIVTAGKKAIDYLVEKYHFGINNYVIIPPAIKSTWKKKIDYAHLPKKLLVVGTITKRKGYERLIEVLSHLKQYDWICDCYGSVSDENLLAHLNHLILQDGLENRIQFCGTIDHNSMDDVYHHYDLLLQLSDEENNSVSLVEAIASGLPFVSTPTGNYSYFKEKNCGFICTTFDSGTIAQELRPFFTHPEKYRSLLQSNDNIKLETWDENIDNLIKFVENQWN